MQSDTTPCVELYKLTIYSSEKSLGSGSRSPMWRTDERAPTEALQNVSQSAHKKTGHSRMSLWKDFCLNWASNFFQLSYIFVLSIVVRHTVKRPVADIRALSLSELLCWQVLTHCIRPYRTLGSVSNIRRQILVGRCSIPSRCKNSPSEQSVWHMWWKRFKWDLFMSCWPCSLV